MRLRVEPHGRGKVRVWIEDEQGKVVASEVGDLPDGRERKRIGESLHAAAPGIPRERIEEELLAHARPAERADEAPEAPVSSTEDASTEAELAEAEEILRSGDLVEQIERDLTDAGVAGEEELKLGLYLVATSRLLAAPLHAIVRGDSSSGKSFVVAKVASLVPPEGLKKATHLSPKALYRMPDLRHRLLVLGERSRQDGAEVEDATKALREFRSEGSITLATVVDGRLAEFTVEGPAATVETTTKDELFDEDANRCLLLGSNEGAEQSERVTLAQAEAAAGIRRGSSDRLRRRHWAMQRRLASIEAPEVVVPFAPALQRAMPKERVQVRRAFPKLLRVVEASALLHAFQRPRDESDRIVADRSDYALAKRLVGPVLAASIGGAPTERVGRFFESLLGSGLVVGSEFTAPELERRLPLKRSQINEQLRALRSLGVVEQTEEAKGPHAATWKLRAAALPSGREFLPEPESIR